MERTFAMGDSGEGTELQVFRTVLFHSVVIIAMPVFSFFFTKILFFDGVLGLASVPSNVYSAIVAVVVLHVALAAFIYRAYFSTQRPKTQAKID